MNRPDHCSSPLVGLPASCLPLPSTPHVASGGLFIEQKHISSTCLKPFLGTCHLQDKINPNSFLCLSGPSSEFFSKLISCYLPIPAPTQCPIHSELLINLLHFLCLVPLALPHAVPYPPPFTSYFPISIQTQLLGHVLPKPSLNPFPSLGHGLLLCASFPSTYYIKLV